MIIHGEIGSSYHHKPMVQGVDDSPLMMMISVGELVKEEWRPVVIPAAVPPPILLWRQPSDSLFRGFVFLRRPLSEGPRGLFL